MNLGQPVTRLPRGRHELSRDEVASRQRARMLAAMAEAMTELGYVNTPVAEIIKRAGVSRETFYQQFSSKQDCFVAALEDTIDGLAGVLASGLAADGTPLQRFERALGAYLDALAADPGTARLFLIESYAAGADVMHRRLALQRRFVDALAAIFAVTSPRHRFACEAIVAATISMVTARFVENDVAGLTDLRSPLVQLAAELLS
jgi:AcrR family transcriptional regulator